MATKLPATFRDMFLGYSGLAPMVEQGTYGKLDVEFTPKIEEYETCADRSMRARIVGIKLDTSGDCVMIQFDYSPWDAHNRVFEQHNYFDKQHNPTLTAREANMYSPQEWIYFELKDNPLSYFTVVEVQPESRYTVIYSDVMSAGVLRVSQIETDNLDETLSHIHHDIVMVFAGWAPRVR